MNDKPDIKHTSIKNKNSKSKAIYIGQPSYNTLDIECRIINEALDSTCYLVGSCLETPDYRDIDIRVMIDDDRFMSMFGVSCKVPPTLSLLCTMLSTMITKELIEKTGLPIDFQIQKYGHISEEILKKERYPLGIFCKD